MKLRSIIILLLIIQTSSGVILDTIERKTKLNLQNNQFVRLVLDDKCVEHARNNIPILVS
jgi:hypothetical protein